MAQTIPIPESLQNRIQEFATYYQVSPERLFWRAMKDGFPDEIAGLTRKEGFKHCRIMQSRTDELGTAFNLWLRFESKPDVL